MSYAAATHAAAAALLLLPWLLLSPNVSPPEPRRSLLRRLLLHLPFLCCSSSSRYHRLFSSLRSVGVAVCPEFPRDFEGDLEGLLCVEARIAVGDLVSCLFH